MTLKKRIAIYLSIFFSVLSGLTFLFIYLSFYQFRIDESKDRLEEKARTTVKLLVDVQEVDNKMLAIINRHSINSIFNEKTLIFNDKFELIYSSVDDAVIKYTFDELKQLKQKKQFFMRQGIYDVLGLYYISNGVGYYVLTSVEDVYGIRKLLFLRNVLLLSFVLSLAIIWFLSFRVVRKMLAPLDQFQQSITEISANQLTLRLQETEARDEINLMAKAFNQMMRRIEMAYDAQKEFNSNASHEMRTPLARMVVRLDNLRHLVSTNHEATSYIDQLQAETIRLTDNMNAVLLLANLSSTETHPTVEPVRMDELIFECLDEIKILFPEIGFEFNITGVENTGSDPEIQVNKGMIKIAFMNLLKNACLYSSDGKVKTELLLLENGHLNVTFINKGQLIDDHEAVEIFKPFFRSASGRNQPGSGLGLSICKRIFDLHRVEITYSNQNNQNEFQIRF